MSAASGIPHAAALYLGVIQFFFATYKMIQFLEVYTFEHGKISEQSVKGLMKKKNGK